MDASRHMSLPQRYVLFDTLELLEIILLLLDDYDLLINAQRVCARWHQTIEASIKLQRKLFFAPDTKHSLPRLNPFVQRKWCIQIFESHTYRSWNEYHNRSGKHWTMIDEDDNLPSAHLRTYASTTSPSQNASRGRSWGQTLLVELLSTPINEVFNEHESCIRREGSWQKMLVMNPPVRYVYRQRIRGKCDSSGKHYNLPSATWYVRSEETLGCILKRWPDLWYDDYDLELGQKQLESTSNWREELQKDMLKFPDKYKRFMSSFDDLEDDSDRNEDYFSEFSLSHESESDLEADDSEEPNEGSSST